MAYLVTPGNSVVTERGHFGPNIPVEITDRDEADALKLRGVIRDTKEEPVIPDDAPILDNTLPPEGEGEGDKRKHDERPAKRR